MKPPSASVVLCVRNGERTIERQLDALGHQEDPPDWELVLVDNGSTDATPQLIRGFAAQLPNLQVLDEPRAGLNCARNLGIRAGSADKIVLCDADDEVSPDWLRTMVSVLDRFDIVGGALDTQRLNDPLVRHQSQNQATELPRVADRCYAVGANVGFRRTVWAAIGGFDERFSGGYDDTDFCLHAQDAGYTIGFEPSAVVHYRLRDRLDHLAKQHFDYGRGEERLLAKRDGLGFADGRLRSRWRILASETRGRAVELPAMIANPAERRQCVEHGAFLAGRFVELFGRSVRPTRRR